MPYARIYSPSKSAMQSGKNKTGYWILQYNTSSDQFRDPVMGWTGSNSTLHQVNMTFDTLENALAFAKKLGLDYKVDTVIETPHASTFKKKSYGDNFRNNKPRL